MKTIAFNSRVVIVFFTLVLLPDIGLLAQDFAKYNENKELIEEYLKAISGNEKNEKMLSAFIDESDSLLIKHILMSESSFPKYELIADDIICDGDIVAIRGVVKGKHLGAMGEIEPTGKEYKVSLMAFYRIKDKKIIEHWVVGDQYSMFKQLGILE